MPTQLLRLPDVRARTGLARSTIYNLISTNAFPRPLKLGERVSAWDADDIDAWIADRRAERDGVAK